MRYETRRRLKCWTLRGLLTILVAGLFFSWASYHYSISINLTESLPGHVYWVNKKYYPKKGELIAFKISENPFYKKNMMFIKIVGGLAGDMVTQKDNVYFINGRQVGRWHAQATSGQAMTKGPVGLIPEGYYFVYTPHSRSFDSRYGRVGWIHKLKVVGTAVELF
ncbi:hypothetical protein MNBD_GAMMA12-3105 [hydrothermal vent metagenome]|uniref:Peptidase S26 domain-containing protein n=1 Tax=hydrothermal vent metagenome TaxID=652676 RepID=A0A3B0Z5Z6_9ZZZZ